MDKQQQLITQIKNVQKAYSLCIDIQHIIIDTEISALNMGKIDFWIQKLITDLYTIDAMHVILKDSKEIVSSQLYEDYLEHIQFLINSYENLKSALENKKNTIGKNLFWQDLFISNVFGSKSSSKNNKEHTLDIHLL